MSTTKDHGKIVVECDCCGETVDTEEKDFTEAMAVAKDEGFSAIKLNNKWQHSCSSACRATLIEQAKEE